LREDSERIRSRETERVLRKLDLSGEQAEAVEHLGRSLVDELIYGPITKVIDTVEETSNSVTGAET
jgi:glutamyl-tRNA reductase